MTYRIPATAAFFAAALLAAGCGGDQEVATEHIRMVLAASGAEEAEDDSETRPVLTLPNGDTVHVRSSVVDFYRDRGYEPAWTDHRKILPRGFSVLESIAAADSEGLDRDRYHFSTARDMARRLEDGEVEEGRLEYLGNLDLLLTESFARFAQDLTVGTIDPREADLDWEIERGTVADRDLIERVVAGEDPREVLGSARPSAPYYERMIGGLKTLRAVAAEGGWPTVPEGETLKPGDTDVRVIALRARLMAGDDERETRLARHGQGDPQRFDDSLAVAVERFQTRHNLHEDGNLGPNTLAALNVPVEDRIQSVRLNLDRWRWLPNDLGEKFLLVNIAGFELEVVENDRVVEAMDVVVGKAANRTPVFQDTLEHMVVNPYWNVPQSIANEEIIPQAMRDPGYLARNNYELVSGDRAIHPNAVSPASLGNYRIRQKPGADNALGDVKFLFPNHHNVYLHDSPATHLFSQRSRAFSHGCIRVERPADLARTLLSMLSDRDPSSYDELRQRSGEQWVPFDEKVPVYILYFTAWVDEDGTLRFHEDIYDHDRSLEREQEDKLAPLEPRPVSTDA